MHQFQPRVTRGPYNQAEGTSFQSRVEFQVDNAQLVRFTGVRVSVMALQGRKSSPQKSRPLESGHRRHAVWIAIEYSYKLGQKSEFKFWCELGWFLQRQSHMIRRNLERDVHFVAQFPQAMHIIIIIGPNEINMKALMLPMQSVTNTMNSSTYVELATLIFYKMF